MAHNVESFVSARQDAWHGLGVVLPENFTAEEAMRHANLGDWDVRKAPMLAQMSGDGVVPISDKFAVIRNNPFKSREIDVLGIVGNAYKIIQNEEHAEFLNTLVDESGAHFETAGSLEGCKKVFITMKLPGFIKIGGVDKVESYLAAVNSHDGSYAFTLMVTPVRIVCSNTLNMAFQNHSHMFRARHTSGSGKIKVQQAREAIDMSFSYLDDFKMEAERLINTSLTQAAFEKIVYKEFSAPRGAAEATIARAESKIYKMQELFAEAATQKNIAGTAWAGLNAMTEWFDHFAPTRGDDRTNSRHQKAVLDPAFKNRALGIMNTYAKIGAKK